MRSKLLMFDKGMTHLTRMSNPNPKGTDMHHLHQHN